MFSVNVLTYGDHAKLTARCLASIMRAYSKKLVSDVRIGMNAVSDWTRSTVETFARNVGVPCYLYEAESKKNVLKYPLMRHMLYDQYRPIKANRVMWFDDDSFINYASAEDWFPLVDSVWNANAPTLMGSPYHPGYFWTPPEVEGIKSQPWYTGVKLTKQPLFMQGGWWVADIEFLSKWDYPCRELKHNGGDVLLGEICRQQAAKLYTFKTGIAINADDAGKESAAKRRGETTPRPYSVHPNYTYDHHKFDVVVEQFIPS